MEIIIEGNLKIMKNMEMELLNIKMEIVMMEIGKMMLLMEEGFLYIKKND